MSLDNRSAILQKQVLNTHKNPQIFLFESSEREDDIVLVRPAPKAIFTKNLMVSKHYFFMAHENSQFNYQSSILSILESQIIPSLLKAEGIRTRPPSLISFSSGWPSRKQIEIFADLCVSQDQEVSQAFADHFLDSGLNKEDIFLELIAPAARFLGSQWEDDQMDFTQVNLGMIRLHAIAHGIRFAYNNGLLSKAKAKVNRVMLASAPGSLHRLGTAIVAEIFRNQDWQVVEEMSSSANELIQAVSGEWFDVIGLSISIEQQLTNLADLIAQLKRVSLNPRVGVLLGGSIFAVKESSADDFGADDICVDAKHAVGLAESLLQTMTQ